jgi:phage terminase Nu1 subunit (DNA packaging protein)
MAKKLVNLRQLSKIMQVTQVTLRDWISKGMPAQRTDRGYLCNPDEVFKWRERFLAEKKQNSEGYEQARTERMIWLAKQAELNYKKQEGLLVDAEAVRQAAFEKARQVRDSLLNIPARISPILAAERDTKKVNEILTNEIRQCLENLSNDLNQEEGKINARIENA